MMFSLLLASLLCIATGSVLEPKVVRTFADSSCGFTSTTVEKTLYFGRDSVVIGTVAITVSDASVDVKYSLNDPYKHTCFFTDEFHVQVRNSAFGDDERLAPGKFSCSVHADSAAMQTVSCPAYKFDSGIKCCDHLYIYTHAVIKCQGSDETETAFAGEQTDGCGRSSRWCRYDIVSAFFHLSKSSHFYWIRQISGKF